MKVRDVLFRGINAAASLKRLGDRAPGHHAFKLFRGINAAASLKQFAL